MMAASACGPGCRKQEDTNMWYFAWILGVLLACSFGLLNAMWLDFYEDLDREAD